MTNFILDLTLGDMVFSPAHTRTNIRIEGDTIYDCIKIMCCLNIQSTDVDYAHIYYYGYSGDESHYHLLKSFDYYNNEEFKDFVRSVLSD